MRLTNYIRDAFIEAAMQDVPKAKDHSEDLRKLVQSDVLSQAPKCIQQAWKDSDAIQYINKGHASFGNVSVAVPKGTDSNWNWRVKLTADGKQKVDELVAEIEADNKMRQNLASKLKGAAYACTTTKQLRELLPEFDKYLPAEEAPSPRSLPVVANIVAEFTKAGWPAKGKK